MCLRRCHFHSFGEVSLSQLKHGPPKAVTLSEIDNQKMAFVVATCIITG